MAWRPRALIVAAAAAALLGAGACADGTNPRPPSDAAPTEPSSPSPAPEPSPDHPSPDDVTFDDGRPVPLTPLPGALRRRCEGAPHVGEVCPRRLPRVAVAYRSTLGGAPEDASMLLDVSAGGPYPRDPDKNRPPRFAHVTLEAGDPELMTDLGPTVPLDGEPADALLDEKRRETMSWGEAGWAGRDGEVLLAASFPFGGIHGDHLVYRWVEGEVTYMVSLHAWTPIEEVAPTLRAIVESIE